MEMQWRSISDLIWINISEFYSCYLANCAYGIITLQIGNLLPHSSSVTTLTLHEFVTNFYAWVAGRLVVLMGNGKLRALRGDLDLKGKKRQYLISKGWSTNRSNTNASLPCWAAEQAAEYQHIICWSCQRAQQWCPKALCEAKTAGHVAEDVFQLWHHGSTSTRCICIFPLTHVNTKNFAGAGRFWRGWNCCIQSTSHVSSS